jgi:hypothetical protein
MNPETQPVARARCLFTDVGLGASDFILDNCIITISAFPSGRSYSFERAENGDDRFSSWTPVYDSEDATLMSQRSEFQVRRL